MDIYTMITDRIIEEMERGIVPWHKPWVGSARAISHVTGKPYSLLNQLLLGGRSGEYLTFRQAREEGGCVRRGEKSSIIVFFRFIDRVDEDTGESRSVPLLKYIPVFHTDQCAGIAPRFIAGQPALTAPAQASDVAEGIIRDYVSRSGVRLIHRQSGEAFYRPAGDEIVLPLRGQFHDTAMYYSTVFHELTHSTGHPDRLGRLGAQSRWGTDAYSREELCAELGASYLVNHVGLETPGSLRNNAAYIAHWLGVLKADKRLLVSAAGKADKAVRLILGEEAGDNEP